MAIQDVLNTGDLNKFEAAARDVGLGNLLAGEGGIRLVREPALAVSGAACTPSFTVIQLLFAKTAATGAPGIKTALINGGTPAAGQAAPNAGGTSITFNAETTGTGTADVSYLTSDPTKVGGVAKKAINDSTYAGVF